MKTTKALLPVATVAASALLWAACSARLGPGGTTIDRDDIAAVVTGSSGPEAGVWVIAETSDLPTKFAKINAFSIWADILPPEEEVVDEEVRSSLLEEIGHVREAALDDDISEDLRRFVLEQVNALERGVREYDVRGIGALRTAIYQVDGGLHIHFGAQPEADEPESVSALRRVYRKARMVAVQATLFTAAISGADDVAKIVGKTARYFLPPPAVEQADIAAPKPKAIDDGKGTVIGPRSQRRNRRTFRRTRDLHFQLEPARRRRQFRFHRVAKVVVLVARELVVADFSLRPPDEDEPLRARVRGI